MAAGRTIECSRTCSRGVDQSQAQRHRLQLRARAGATTCDGYGRSALDPFGGGGVCIGEVDAASELIADAALLPTARALAPPLAEIVIWSSSGELVISSRSRAARCSL
jgi:hypothetical protein